MTPPHQTPTEIIARCGRSFHLASRFLPVATRERAIRLYAFCRILDDIADDDLPSGSANPAAELKQLSEELKTSSSSAAQLYRSVGLRHDEPARALINALAGDTQSVRILSEDELLRYSYGVAGTVGLMMAEILGAESSEASAHAIDLGLAMQLVNICRDVREDAAINRVYLPSAWLGESLNAQDLSLDARPAWPAVIRALDLAEHYFESGFRGLRYLPNSCRRAIWIAGSVYREIGVELRRRGPQGLNRRTVVPSWRKGALVTRCFFTLSSRCPWQNNLPHRVELHSGLKGCWGSHV